MEAIGVIEGTSAPSVMPLEIARERTRAAVVFTLLGMLAAVIFLPFVLLVVNDQMTDAHWDIIKVSLSGLLGLIGSAIGFYFRSTQK